MHRPDRAYDRSGTEVGVRVHDPNRGQRDDVWIRFDTSRPTKPTVFEHYHGMRRPVRGFFRTAHTPTAPPAVPAPAAVLP